MSSPVERSRGHLQVEDVYKSYGGKVVLDNVDLSVQPGELCTLVGPSGCGKSTLLRLILGEEFPTAGSLRVDGLEIGPPDVRRGIVFQRYSLFPHLSVVDNVSLGLRLRHGARQAGQDRRAVRDVAMSYLERVRLAGHADKYPHQLSGGMQQRVAIAQSLVMKPKILLMDEPFGALDPDTREDMQIFLLELWEQDEMMIFFVTHDLEEAAYLGTRILVLSQYYRDDRGSVPGVSRGAKIVADHQLPRAVMGTGVKHTAEFTDLITQIRQEGFDPGYLQHARDFNLSHPDAYRTLTTDEHAS